MDTCACGHVQDEHRAPKHALGSTACQIDGCPCECYEWDGNEDDIMDLSGPPF